MEKAPKGYGYVYYGRGVHLKSNEWIKEQKGKSNKKAKQTNKARKPDKKI